MRRTRIVATLGPASDAPGILGALVEAGVDVFRLNFSHGSHDEHARRIAAVREAAASAGRPVALLQDLQGPKIRTGRLRDGSGVELTAGSELRITTADVAGDAARVSTTYASLPGDVQTGDRVFLSDGLIELQVVESADHELLTRVVVGGLLRENQGINLPGVSVSAPALTGKDREDLAFGLAAGVDWVALSFVRRHEDVEELRELIRRAGHDTPVVAKIERPEAVAAFDSILEVVDGVMVARGDLGVELSPERVPLVQKHLIRASRRRARPVITATEMLESMIERPRPTRAEASDVANAILDGSDAVMLSGETAVGRHPLEAVHTMVRIATEVEPELQRPGTLRHGEPEPRPSDTAPEAIAAAAAALVQGAPSVAAICVYTHSGGTARLISSHRPRTPVLAFSDDEGAVRRMSLLWGVRAQHLEAPADEAELERRLLAASVASGVVRAGDPVVLTGSHPLHEHSPTNFLKLARA